MCRFLPNRLIRHYPARKSSGQGLTVPNDMRCAVLDFLDSGDWPRRACGEREAAQMLGVSAMTLGNWRRGVRKRCGRFPFTVYSTPAGTYQYDRAELRAYIEAHSRRGRVFKAGKSRSG